MPHHLRPVKLYEFSCKEVASLVFRTCKRLDNELEKIDDEDRPHEVFSSPTKSPCKTPDREELCLQLSPRHRNLLEWLSNLPDRVVEDVIKYFLEKLETHLLEDMDNKLILTLINIEKMRMNDFYFGLYSLFLVIQGFQLERLEFSVRLWSCLSQYGEITSCRYLSRTLALSLPGLSGLTSLNIAHVATDQLVCAISRHLTALTCLDMSHSHVTDKAIKYLTGTACISQAARFKPSTSAIRNLSSALDGGSSNNNSQSRHSTYLNISDLRPGQGCFKLEVVRLQSCDGVTERGVMLALEHLQNLRLLEYHQKYSILETLIKWSSNYDNSERMMQLFKLTELEHGFPYGVNPLSDQLTNLSMMLPRLSSLTIVTTDSTAALLSLFSNLTLLTLELEDYLGEGFLDFLAGQGSRLKEVNVSCSTDPESPLSLDQLGGPAGQQGQLFNAALLAVGQLCPAVRKLSISGCGVVSSAAVTRLQLGERLANTSWLRRHTEHWFPALSSFILMSYDDTHPSMTVHSGLLKCVLSAAKNITILNLEGHFGTFFNDTYFESILSLNPLTQLNILDVCISDDGSTSGRLVVSYQCSYLRIRVRTFHHCRIPLTMKTIQLVLARCGNIKEMRISDWSITTEEFNQLATNIRENNWDLKVSRKSRV